MNEGDGGISNGVVRFIFLLSIIKQPATRMVCLPFSTQSTKTSTSLQKSIYLAQNCDRLFKKKLLNESYHGCNNPESKYHGSKGKAILGN